MLAVEAVLVVKVIEYDVVAACIICLVESSLVLDSEDDALIIQVKQPVLIFILKNYLLDNKSRLRNYLGRSVKPSHIFASSPTCLDRNNLNFC